jgi:signal transduction histidine kinase
VLDLSAIEAGRVKGRPALALAELLRECVSLMRPLADARRSRWSPDPAALVLADRTRLKQVLLNLLSNAVKYSRKPAGVLKSRPPRQVRITVGDTGPGIPPEYRARCSNPSRACAWRTRPSKAMAWGWPCPSGWWKPCKVRSA